MKISIYLLLITSFSVFSAEKAGTDDEQQLLISCQSLAANPEQENAKACMYFMQGFIEAVRTIDPLENRNQKKPGFTGLMSRPYRNPRRYLPHRFFPFCVPETESTRHVIKTVLKRLRSQFDNIEKLQNEIFKELKYSYPCGRAQQN